MTRTRFRLALRTFWSSRHVRVAVLPLVTLAGTIFAMVPVSPASADTQIQHVCRDAGNSGGVHAIFCTDLMLGAVTGIALDKDYVRVEAFCQTSAGTVECSNIDVFAATPWQGTSGGAHYTVWHKGCGQSTNPACGTGRNTFAHDYVAFNPASICTPADIWGVTLDSGSFTSQITLPNGAKVYAGGNLGTPHDSRCVVTG